MTFCERRSETSFQNVKSVCTSAHMCMCMCMHMCMCMCSCRDVPGAMQQLADALQALLCCFSCCPASRAGDERPARKAHDDVPPAVDSESAKYLSDNVAYVDSRERAVK